MVYKTPQLSMAKMGFIFVLRILIKQRINNDKEIKLILLSTYIAFIRIAKPALAIKATMTGRMMPNIFCIKSILRYLKYKLANIDTINSDGKITAKVDTIAPNMPAIFIPTKVAEFTAIGPGVISAIVIKSVNSFRLSQAYFSTT